MDLGETVDIDAIKELRRRVRESSSHHDGRAGMVSQAIEKEMGFTFRWGHILLMDGYVFWLHCWNELSDGSILDSTVDQFEDRFPGDVILIGRGESLHEHYRSAPPHRLFESRVGEASTQEISVTDTSPDGSPQGEPRTLGCWPRDPVGWSAAAKTVLAEMSPWPPPADVLHFVASALPEMGHAFRKRDLEGMLDVWDTTRRRQHTGHAWTPDGGSWTLRPSESFEGAICLLQSNLVRAGVQG